MASNAVVTGPTAERVAKNVERVRKARQLNQKDVSALLKDVGRPMLPTVVSKIERGDRRVDVDDLMALALALNVSPLSLLLPPTAGNEPVDLTQQARVTGHTAWAWARGERPAMDWEPGEGVSLAEPGADPAIAAQAYEREQEYGRRRTDYLALALPEELRRAATNPLLQPVGQLEGFVEDIVGPRGDRAERLRWIRMALRRVDAIKSNLEELAEVLANGDGGLEELKRQYPGMFSHVQAKGSAVTNKPGNSSSAGSDADAADE